MNPHIVEELNRSRLDQLHRRAREAHRAGQLESRGVLRRLSAISLPRPRRSRARAADAAADAA